MSTTFVPPRPDQWEGPAKANNASFTPPPVSSWEGPAAGLPSFPKGNKPATLPDVTNEDIKGWGRTALNYAPAIGATAAALTQPELLPAVGAAMLGGAAGSAIKQGALAATGQSDAPKSLGQAAGEVGKDALTQGAMEAGGRMLAKPIELVGRRIFSPSRMYQSALKPSVALDKSMPQSVADMEAQKRVATGLREGIPASEGGYDTARNRIDDVNSQIRGVFQNRPNANTPLINPMDVAQRLDTLEQFYKGQALPAADVREIQTARQQYLTKHGAQFDPNTGQMTQPPNLVTPIEAQQEKQATYAVNRKKYGQLTTASDESEKALARGLKEELVKIYPELADLNERDTALYGLEQSLRRFVGREGNKNLVGLIPAIMGTGAGIVAGHGAEGAMGGSMLGAALMALDNATVKSNLAIALSRAGQSRLGRVLSTVTPTRALPAAGRLIEGATQPQPMPSIPQFAKGGIVTKPTVGLLGEKEPEAVVPTRVLNQSGPGKRILNSLSGKRAAEMGAFYTRRSARLRPVVQKP